MPEAPFVAVLLLNWNGWLDTIECLESVCRLDYPRMAVVVCDNASTDGSVDRVREWARGALTPQLPTPESLRRFVTPPVSKPVPVTELTRAQAETGTHSLSPGEIVLIQTGGNLGFAGGNNVGLRYLLGQSGVDFVWILNNDIVVEPGSLGSLVKVAAGDPRVGAVGGVLYEYSAPKEIQNVAGGLFPPWKGLSIPLKKVRYQADGDGLQPVIDFLSAGCMLMSLEALRQVGVIDEDYFLYGEDVDFSLRIRAAGYRLAVAEEARVWHKGGGAVRHRSARHDYYIVRNSLHLVRKYYPRMLPVATSYVAVKCVLPKLVRGQWQRLAVLRRAYGDFRNHVFGAPDSLPGEPARNP